MMRHSLRETLDRELAGLTFTAQMREQVLRQAAPRPRPLRRRCAAALAALVLLAGTTALAVHWMGGRVLLNREALPELDPMEVVDIAPLPDAADQYGRVRRSFTDYTALCRELGLPLLESPLAAENPYMLGTLETDGRDFGIITVQNYILGDTGGYRYLPEQGRYQYRHGEEYYSPVTLSVDLILSEAQLENGWDTDYLGAYEYLESYTARSGWRVHLFQDGPAPALSTESPPSEKYAVFVAQGVRYTLKCRTSVQTMKQLVDTMG